MFPAVPLLLVGTAAAGASGPPTVTVPVSVGEASLQFSPTNAYVDIWFETDGDIITGAQNLKQTDRGDWVDNKVGLNSALYEIKAVLVSGDTPSVGTMDTWLGLGTERNWGLNQTSLGAKTSIIDFTIREIANPSNSDVVRCTFNVEVA